MSLDTRRSRPWSVPVPRPPLPGANLGRALREAAAELELLSEYTVYAATQEDVLTIAQKAHGVASPLAFQLDLLLGHRPSVAGARAYALEHTS